MSFRVTEPRVVSPNGASPPERFSGRSSSAAHTPSVPGAPGHGAPGRPVSPPQTMLHPLNASPVVRRSGRGPEHRAVPAEPVRTLGGTRVMVRDSVPQENRGRADDRTLPAPPAHASSVLTGCSADRPPSAHISSRGLPDVPHGSCILSPKKITVSVPAAVLKTSRRSFQVAADSSSGPRSAPRFHRPPDRRLTDGRHTQNPLFRLRPGPTA